MRLAVQSYLCKSACEYLIDQIGERADVRHEDEHREKHARSDRSEKKEE